MLIFSYSFFLNNITNKIIIIHSINESWNDWINDSTKSKGFLIKSIECLQK